MLRTWWKRYNGFRRAYRSKHRLGSPKPARGKFGQDFEQLEARETPAAVSWIGGPSGYWDVAANWSGGAVPNSAAQVSIDTTSAATITIQAGDTEAINSLSIGSADTLSMPGGGSPGIPTSNLLTNPDFTAPVGTSIGATAPSGWSAWGGADLSKQYAFTGLQSLQTSGATSGVSQTFKVTPGASYTLSADAMAPASSPLTGSEGAYIQVIFLSSTGAPLSLYNPPNAVTVLTSSNGAGGPLTGSVGNQGWNHFSTTAVAPYNAATAQVTLVAGAFNGTGPGSGTVYWDDAAFGLSAPGPSNLVAGSVSNSGVITVGPTNSIAASGAFVQTATGSLDLQLGGPPANGYNGAVSAGSASLGGTLKADLVYGYLPLTTDAFTPITFASATGAFATYQLPAGSGYQFQSAISFTNVTLSAVPTTPVTATVNAAGILHAANTNVLGVNLEWWDADDTSAQTQSLVQSAGLTTFRFPGGSSADNYHFNMEDNYGDTSAITLPQFVQFIQTVGGTGLVTLDYGSGSPQEAAAELAYLQGAPTDSTVIGVGLEWNDSANQWQYVNWQTVGYWASLRAASPSATDDGLNFLRIDHPAPFSDIEYWEVGNEEYGSWEIDHHGTPGPNGVSTGVQRNPATYVAFAKQFATYATEILNAAHDPAISIGIDSGDPTGQSDNNWTKNVLASGLSIGFVPGFISDHSYVQTPGLESDSFLLNGTVTNANTDMDWSTRFAEYQSLLQATLGARAASVQVMATEFNSVYTNPGKQSTSLVNGLFVAESIGSLLDSGYMGGYVWDLRNGWLPSDNNSETLYGWRNGGDYGLLGDGSQSAPASSLDEAYPSYFAEQLAGILVQGGGQVVSVSTNYQDLVTYGVLEPNGHLDLLVINTNPTAGLNVQFNVAGFQPSAQATFWQYGKTQDTAQSRSPTGAAALATFNATLNVSGNGFAYAIPSYSMTVIDLAPASKSAVAPAVAKVTVNGGTAPIFSASESRTTVTVITNGPHGFSVGQSVLIAGSSAAYNGVHVIASIPADNRFTYTNTITGLKVASGGTATPAETTSGLLLGSQRSMVDSIIYTFNQPVKLGANAFTLVVHSSGTVPALSYASPDGGLTWVVTFSGSGVVGNSIANGAYDITLNKAAVTAAVGGASLASSRTDAFDRLFGDSNSAQEVNTTDERAFNAANSSSYTLANYNPALDVDGNGKINTIDQNAFNADFGKSSSGFTTTI